MGAIKTLGILTSGGDCPGLNAVIRGVVQHAIEHFGCEVIGINEAQHGLLADPPRFQRLTLGLFEGELLRAGGTMLGATTQGDPWAYPDESGGTSDRSGDIIKAIRHLGVDAMVVIGGDGSMRIFDKLLTPSGIPWVGVPKTIDNDVPGTDFSVGFITAVDIVGSALDRLHTTATSHRRIMVLETMGRESGFLALYGGVAGGADAILMPELRYDITDLIAHIKRIRAKERAHILVVVAEGTPDPKGALIGMPYFGSNRALGGVGTVLADALAKGTGVSTRCTVLGHLQRGGTPAVFDRLLGSAMGVNAVDTLMKGETRKMSAWTGGHVTTVDMDVAITGPRVVDPHHEMLETARGLGIYVGTPRKTD